MWTTIAFLIGGAFGYVFMCLFQINWHEAQEEYRLSHKEYGVLCVEKNEQKQ